MPFSLSRRLKASMSSVRKAICPRSTGLMAGAEAHAKVLLGQVQLRGAIGDEGHLAGVAALGHAALVEPGLGRQVEHRAIERLHGRYVARAQVYMVQLDLHGRCPVLSVAHWRLLHSREARQASEAADSPQLASAQIMGAAPREQVPSDNGIGI